MTEPLGRDVLERLLAHPSLRDTLTWTQVQRFIRLSRRLWPEILGTSASPPQLLPQNICGFLSSVLSLEFDLVQLSWTAFCDMVPSLELGPNHIQDDDMFRVHGHEFGVGMHVSLLRSPKATDLLPFSRSRGHTAAHENLPKGWLWPCPLE
jgi:hypothetical protein